MKLLDTSRVPAEKLNDPRLAELEEFQRLVLADQAVRLGVCVHEAAHAIYAERAGAVRITYHRGIVRYDAETDSFLEGQAGIEPHFGAVAVTMEAIAMARWYAAGGVAKRILIAAADPGDEDDFEVFTAECRRYAPTATPEQILGLWKQAQRDEKDLRSPAFRREVWERAHSFDVEVFQPLLTPSAAPEGSPSR